MMTKLIILESRYSYRIRYSTVPSGIDYRRGVWAGEPAEVYEYIMLHVQHECVTYSIVFMVRAARSLRIGTRAPVGLSAPPAPSGLPYIQLLVLVLVL